MTEKSIYKGLLKSSTLYHLGTPLVLIVMLAMMILPLKPFFLDILFTFNISLSLIVLLACIYTDRPLNFSIFPSILLVATLLRLSLNVASTRVVLLNGHNGAGAAGEVIRSFGEVVIGGNYTVGLVVFTILVIINFVVVTKGAGRISEVSARFTLDAMPGKQMAIDADLNAGLVTPEEAKRRRAEVAEEADFYGSMDGASKFVRGDAIAGLLVLAINLIGGFAIGVAQYEMSFSQAAHTYAILTIGDGLAAQVPSLLLSTAAAIMVTRVSSAQDMGSQMVQQLFTQPKALAITAGIIGILGLIPGMPHLAFLGLGIIGLTGAYYIYKNQQKRLDVKPEQHQTLSLQEAASKELDWDDVSPVDIIGLEIGYRLINLVDATKNGLLLSRIKGIRKKLSQQVGFLIPVVHIRDNLDLAPNGYRISLMGVMLGAGEVFLDKELAINPGNAYGQLDGILTRDPAFNLEAYWINADQKEQAQSLNYTVVDSSTVIATHLSQILSQHAYELLGHEEVQQLLNKLQYTAPKLVEALTPNALPLSVIVKVLQQLLQERIPIVDLRTIAETLVESATKTQDPDQLTMLTRIALKRLLVQGIDFHGAEFSVVTLSADLEQILHKSLQAVTQNGMGLEPSLAGRLQQSLTKFGQEQSTKGEPAVLLVSPQVRQFLARLLRYSVPDLTILSYQEIPDDKQIKILGTVG